MARPRGGNRRTGPSNQAIAQRFALGLATLRIIEAVTAIVVLAMLVYGVMTQQYLFALPVVIIGLVFLASTVLDIRLQRQMVKEEAKSTGSSFADIVRQALDQKEADDYYEAYNRGELGEVAHAYAVERS